MCGIAAIFSFQRGSSDLDGQIRKMSARMAHRGPDADDFYVNENVALGHRRLAIIDLSPLGNQPMWDHSGRYGIVFNGEIYNYRDLKAQLPDYPFRSSSDTEVILAGFATWGTAVFEKLNGIFAFVIYDKTARCVYAVRDRFSIKPLYFHQSETAVYFASEVRPIIGTAITNRKISAVALSDYISNGAVAGSQRMCAGIQQLDGGHYLQVTENKTVTTHCYRRFFDGDVEPVSGRSADVQRKVKDLLLQSVERQMVSDVPLGAFLSGGIDSSAIVALMSEVSSVPPLTFTIGFADKNFDETPYANIIAERYKTNHTTLKLSPDDFLQELPNALAAMDTPTLDGPNTFVVSKLTRQSGVTVALSGLGGDELFAGYSSFQRYFQWKQKWWWHLPQWTRSIAGMPLAQLGLSSKYRRLGELLCVPVFDIEHVYPIFRGIFDYKTLGQIQDGNYNGNPSAKRFTALQGQIEKFPLLSQYSIAEMLGYTSHMLLKDTDQMSMASSLEVRVPFFDNDLVDYVLRIPDTIKYPHTPKSLLVSALGGRLPDEVVNRPKMGFTLPWENWIRQDLFHFCNDHIKALCDRNILNPNVLRRMWADFQKGNHQVLWSHIWMFVVLEEWLLRNEVDGVEVP